MGLLKNFEGDAHETEPVDLVSNINVFDHSSSSEDEENVQESTSTIVQPAVLPTVNRTPKIKKVSSKIPKPILHIKNIGGKKSQGHRQAQRHENMCFLLNLAKDLDEDFTEVNFNDLVETTISVFAQLLLSKNKMKIWNEFIELPENQQETIIKKKKKKIHHDKNENFNTTKNRRQSDENFETFILIENHSTIDEKEEADKCFHRIDSNIRQQFKTMMKRRHLPLDRINWFEDDVIPFFKEHPDSVYLRDLKNSFDRMLLHAVCQYLNLISKSFTQNGERYIQIENHRIQFIPPIIRLSEYLKSFEKKQ